MKFLFVLFLIFGFCLGIYILIIHLKNIKNHWKEFPFVVAIGTVLFGLVVLMAYKGSKTTDTWCSYIQNSTSYPPQKLVTSMDYFELGNFFYDSGKCTEAVIAYTKSVDLNPKYPQAYNNMAYTQMRMGNYKEALSNLEKALALDPNYINALMNRGDIYRDRLNNKEMAIADYEKIISIAGAKGTSVCGHLAMAKYKDSGFLSFFRVPLFVLNCRGWL